MVTVIRAKREPRAEIGGRGCTQGASACYPTQNLLLVHGGYMMGYF